MYGRTATVVPGRYRHTDGETGHEREVTVATGRTVYRLNSNCRSRARGIHVWCDVDGERLLLPARDLRS